MRRAAVVLLGASFACGFDGTRDEVSRATSPSGVIDAVLVETNGGATTSFGYEAYLVKKGGSVSDGTRVATWYGAFRSDRAYGINLRWRGNNALALEYLSAKGQRLERAVVPVGGE